MKYHLFIIVCFLFIGFADVFAEPQDRITDKIVYSTYFGGGGADIVFGMASDKNGNIYITGNTSSLNLPVKSAAQPDYGGGEEDAFVTKFSPDGEIIYTTYIGGSDEEYGFNVTADDNGYAYLTGKTLSGDFPIKNAFQVSHKGEWDGYVVKLAPFGSIIFSTYLGGRERESGYDIKVDEYGYIYVTGKTWSPDFPIKDALQPQMGGGTTTVDAFVTKLSPDGELIFSTFFGGSDWDYSYTLALDKNNNIIFGGRTNSSDFPLKNEIQRKYGGGQDDACITKLSNDGKSLLFSTFWGGGEFDRVMDIALDRQDNIFVLGHTESKDFPTKKPVQKTMGGGENDVFITKISNTYDEILFSTYLGGEGYDYSSNITVDEQGNCYLTGRTTSIDFPLKNPAQPTHNGDIDAFLSAISYEGQLLFSTFWGGSAKDEGRGLALVHQNLYIACSTQSLDLMVKNSTQSSFNGGGWDAFIVKFSLK